MSRHPDQSADVPVGARPPRRRKEPANYLLYELFMFILTISILAAISFGSSKRVGPQMSLILDVADVTICVIFLIDFLWRLITSENRLKYLFTWGIFDFVSSLPIITSLRYIRLLRAVRAIRLIRGLKSLKRVIALIDRSKARGTAFSAVLVLLFTLFVGSASVLNFESASPNSNIRTAGDALWWTCVTMTTTGYGDFAPSTAGGRITAVCIMVSGLALTAVVTALLRSWVIKTKETQEPYRPNGHRRRKRRHREGEGGQASGGDGAIEPRVT